jgi:hypothetical protein
MDHSTPTVENLSEDLIEAWDQPGSLSEMEHKITLIAS